MNQRWEKGHGERAVETAERILELIHDLGECQDSRQILVAACRHFHVLFDEFKVFGLLMGDPNSDSFRLLSVENPYKPTWGGIQLSELPERTDTDEILRRLGKDVTNWMHRDKSMVQAFREGKPNFVVTDNPVAVRLAGLTGTDCRTFMIAEWSRPVTGQQAWTILGYEESREVHPEELAMFATAVETTSRMAYYPAIINYLERTRRVNNSVRRNIVHDLKTPITVIKGYALTLQSDDIRADTEMVHELLVGVLDSCDRLLEDIKDILEPIEEAWIPKSHNFDLALLLHKVVLAESHTDRSKNHTLQLEGADEPLVIHADLRKLRRVYENLLSNAVKYSPGHDKTVTVTLYRHEGKIKVAITDEGIGMSEAQLKKVMNEGGRVAGAEFNIEGAGFGLISTTTVLEAHGGSLEGLSSPGVGSTFTAILPSECLLAHD